MSKFQPTPRQSATKQAALARRLSASATVAPHVLATTVAIDSSEQVLVINGSYFVASQKFAHRYYRVIEQEGIWYCSSRDERIAAKCKAMVEMHRIQQEAA